MTSASRVLCAHVFIEDGWTISATVSRARQLPPVWHLSWASVRTTVWFVLKDQFTVEMTENSLKLNLQWFLLVEIPRSNTEEKKTKNFSSSSQLC
jgi:hypothetical protein